MFFPPICFSSSRVNGNHVGLLLNFFFYGYEHNVLDFVEKNV